MGQTLTHGIYLPDEGERNCYNGLASNWSILDGAVGTIAEHTSALAGKAPLVHTHTKSDITDFPVLANVATSGSYNDLSNIPASFTPSSHTHGNLTNDGKVGTTANVPLITGTDGVVQAGSFGTSANTFCEGNDSRLSDARTPVAHTHGKADITDLFNSVNTWSANNTFSAGAYFYNSDSTAATSTLNLRNSKVTKGGTSDNGSQIIQFLDKDNKFLSQITTTKALSGTTQLQFTLGNTDGNNNSITGSITFSLAIDGTKQFIPGSNNTHNLGNSSYQWNNLYAKKVNTQSVNGVNPGALSFFDTSSGGDIINTNNWMTNGGGNEYTPTENGWVYFRIAGVSGNYIVIRYTYPGQNYPTISQEAVSLHISVCAPAIAGIKMYIYIIGSIEKAYFYPALGNV